MKFGVKVEHGPGRNWLDFDGTYGFFRGSRIIFQDSLPLADWP